MKSLNGFDHLLSQSTTSTDELYDRLQLSIIQQLLRAIAERGEPQSPVSIVASRAAAILNLLKVE